MKDADFTTLEQGTVVLLRPFGPGARDKDAQDHLVLAELGPATPLTSLGFSHYKGIPDWVPGGYIPHMGGKYRAITLLRDLPRLAETDDDDAWETFAYLGSAIRRAVLSRDVIGPWADVREEVLTARRERIAAMVQERTQREAEEGVHREEFDRALAALRPLLEAEGLGEHRALSEYAAPRRAYFTAEEVARLIDAARETERAGGEP